MAPAGPDAPPTALPAKASLGYRAEPKGNHENINLAPLKTSYSHEFYPALICYFLVEILQALTVLLLRAMYDHGWHGSSFGCKTSVSTAPAKYEEMPKNYIHTYWVLREWKGKIENTKCCLGEFVIKLLVENGGMDACSNPYLIPNYLYNRYKDTCAVHMNPWPT